MDNKKNKTIVSTLMILTIIFILAGGTLAFWRWDSTTNTGVTFTVTSNYSCSVDGGENISNEEVLLAPTKNCNGPNAIKRELTVSTDITDLGSQVNMNLWLEASNIGTELANSDYFKYRLTTSETDCNKGIISEGVFTDLQNGSKNYIFNNQYYNSTTEKYYLYIWLGHEENNNKIQNQTFNLSINGECGNQLAPAKPVLDPGMIPVTIENDGTVRTISSEDPNWYNYDEKKWANVVLVNKDATEGVANSKSRNEYKSTLASHSIVAEEDILAYYVWIPRYRYQIWTTDPTQTTNPQTINIEFEQKEATISDGKQVGEYMTHPAFIWDGETVAGIWVGKFEISAEKTSQCYIDQTHENCDNGDQLPRILPNVIPIYRQTTGNQFKTSLNFANGEMSDIDGSVTFKANADNIYGLNTTTYKTDSHMMKNSEWGAMLYLSHSMYGINTNVAHVSDKADILTGTGSTSEYNYGLATSYPQSTTGNITGVFDITGDRENVMGKFEAEPNVNFPVLPERKYYDLYKSSQFTGNYKNNLSFCSLETCGGHALYETNNWYGGDKDFVYNGFPWFVRGVGFSYAKGYGSGSSGGGSGNGSYYSGSWRSVLITNVNND